MNKYISVILLVLLASCTDMHDPELHAMGKVEVRPAIEQDVDIDLMWQVDWKTKWQVDWDTQKLGALGYSEPTTFHLDYYQADNDTWLGERNIAGNSIRVSLAYGTYHLLAYNNDFQDIRIDDGKRTRKNSSTTKVSTHSVIAYTDRDPYAMLTDSLSQVLTVNQMPDQLFSAYATNVVVSDRLDDYVFIPEENIYLLRLNATLQPRVFIYLVQVELLHNNGRVTGSGALTVDGLAESVDLLTTQPSDKAIAYQFASIFQDKAKFSANTKADNLGDNRTLIGGRLTTFGRTASSTNKCYVTLYYAKGGLMVVPVDITDQMKALPKGGVINITLDVDKLGNPKSGFNLNVGDWDEENHYQGV